MFTLSCLENSKSGILYEIPAGKPDPRQLCPKENDRRDRVIQAAAKGMACWYYSFKFIRRLIGKNPCPELKEAREIEARCSAYRKTLLKEENSLPNNIYALSEKDVVEFFQEIDRSRASRFILDWKTMGPKFIDPKLEKKFPGRPSILFCLQEFVKRNDEQNFYDFLLKKFYSVRNEASIKLLKSFNVDPEKEFEAQITLENGVSKGLQWKKLSIVDKALYLEAFVRQCCAQKYGLKISKWTPLRGFDLLLSELRENGPLCIGGAFGVKFYVDDPFIMSKKISGRKIYGWKPGAKREPIINVVHSVLLIGAKKVKDKGYAYFIDPNDPSDPKDISKQRIFIISYENLCKSISDIGVITPDSPARIGYAYHGSFKSE